MAKSINKLNEISRNRMVATYFDKKERRKIIFQ